ncbi:hypothetical protein [Georgenia sp. AZ-5]|uniref:hypothetical protein n=1 Tax=Georgenia sp. AZ-5 TaxID=3367526 RepID=UPI0037551393
MSAPTTTAPVEPSAWLRGRMAQLVNAAQAAGLDPHHGRAVIVQPLGTTGKPGTRADRECDRCATYVPQGQPLYPLVIQPAARMVLCGGLCDACHRKEVGA